MKFHKWGNFMDIQKALGKALKKVRLHKAMSQESLSDVSSRTYMSVLERGQKSPKVEKIDVIARAMGVHPITIFTIAYAEIDGLPKSDLLKLVSNEIEELYKSESSN